MKKKPVPDMHPHANAWPSHMLPVPHMQTILVTTPNLVYIHTYIHTVPKLSNDDSYVDLGEVVDQGVLINWLMNGGEGNGQDGHW